jgi:hypothetical protein
MQARRSVDHDIEIAMELQVLEAVVEHEYIAIKVARILVPISAYKYFTYYRAANQYRFIAIFISIT